MAATILEGLHEFFAKQLSSSLERNNYDVYKTRLNTHPNFSYIPRYVYFYYINITPEGELDVRHYTHSESVAGVKQPIPRDKIHLEGIASRLAQNARVNGTSPISDGQHFKDIVWTKKSYIIVFLDESGWDFHDFDMTVPGVVFSAATPNHSFYDALKLDVPMPGGTTRSAIAFINHMKRDDAGNDLKGNEVEPHDRERRQAYKFDMALDVKYTDASVAPMLITMDPGGENQGPPEIP